MPPDTEQFSTSERNIPELVFNLLLEELLQLEKHGVSRTKIITRVVESYIVQWVSRGEITTSKYFQTLSVGIRNPQHYRFI